MCWIPALQNGPTGTGLVRHLEMEITMTKKLYDLDAYATEFDAVVLSCEAKTEGEKTEYQVILDQTLFFPEEGGQSPDKGMLGKANVLDVQIKNDIITHTLDAPVEGGTSGH